ncbi:unnamed protein product [Prorocentrum cordatum]|uniref:carnosine N-methyltransferase n=1 Tax=Prorocentrum cordatum TaxID=2364126 RepID=A0ABN9TZN1_9DINO|nr:unnamed protein product [Polarella glacialis]
MAAHWAKGHLDAIRTYRDHSKREVARVKRNLEGLSADDQASLVWKAADQIQAMEEAVRANFECLDKIVELIKESKPPAHGPVSGPADGHKAVQNMLQLLVREWTQEGEVERKECHERIHAALDGHLKPQLESARAEGKPPPRVLVPGSQMGRLLYEVCARGYDCEACEARPLPYFGGELVRRHGAQIGAHRIQPFALNTCNRFKKGDHVRVTPVPDVEVPVGSLPTAALGDLIKLYDTAPSRGSFDAVATAFTLDTSSNIFRFIRTVAHVVREGGLWVNFGPLCYDSGHDEARGSSMELSWEELKHAVSHFFEVQEEDFVDSFHAANAESMMQIQYSCVYFKAVRKANPSLGIGGS